MSELKWSLLTKIENEFNVNDGSAAIIEAILFLHSEILNNRLNGEENLSSELVKNLKYLGDVAFYFSEEKTTAIVKMPKRKEFTESFLSVEQEIIRRSCKRNEVISNEIETKLQLIRRIVCYGLEFFLP